MKIIKLMKGLYKYIILMIIASITQVYCELKLPNTMSDIVNNAINSLDKTYVYNNCLIMIGITLLCLIANTIVIYSSSKFSNKYGYNIRKALFSKINSLNKKEISSYGASTLITRSTNNVSNITSTFSFGLKLMLFAPITAIGASIMAFKVAKDLSPVIIVSASILVISILIIFGLVFKKFELSQKLFDDINSKSREIISGLRIIKSFNKTKFFKKRFDKTNKDNMNLNIYLNKVLYLVQPIVSLTVNIGVVIIVYLSSNLLQKGTLEIGSMMAFIQYEGSILMSFVMLLMIIINIPRVVISFKRINEILNTETKSVSKNNIEIKNLESIEFSHVYYKYEKAKDYVLKDINFKIEENEKVGIIGSSGSGKTTIINLLLRHLELEEGNIYINGIDIKEYSISSLRKLFSYAPGKALLFKGTIRENLIFDNNISDKEIMKALEIAKIDDFVLSNKEKLDFKIEQGGVNLSGGQKQRLIIARAILNNGKMFIFDDSFSAVDYITDKKIRNEIKENYKNVMQLYISQRVSTIEDASNIIVLDEGKIESSGTYKELKTKSKVFKEFIKSQRKEI